MKINIVVLMAGSGHRFKEAGYTKHKPLIDVNGEPMIRRVIENLRPKTRDYRFIFVCLKSMVTDELREIFSNEKESYVIELPHITEGAACTAMTAMGITGNEEPLIIAACDQLVDIPIDDFIDYSWKHDSCLMTFENNEPSHSYSYIDDMGTVTEVVEKPDAPKQPHANVGIYWFKESDRYGAFCNYMMHDCRKRVNGEWYVAPVINEMVGSSYPDIRIYEVPKDKVHLLGTPKELNDYTGAA